MGTIDEWKSWVKSRTVWINGIVGAFATVQLFIFPLIEQLSPEMAVKVLGITLIVNNVINIVLRFLTKLKLYTGKFLPGPNDPKEGK